MFFYAGLCPQNVALRQDFLPRLQETRFSNFREAFEAIIRQS
jgi:hypothetical protein